MPIFIDPTKREEYVLETQRKETPEEQVRFLLKVMTAREWAAMASEEVSIPKAEGRPATGVDANNALIRHGCVGWKAAAGQPTSSLDGDGHLSWDSLARIPLNLRNDLADAVLRLNTLYEDDLGNSP
jgi:hypothetical protein